MRREDFYLTGDTQCAIMLFHGERSVITSWPVSMILFLQQFHNYVKFLGLCKIFYKEDYSYVKFFPMNMVENLYKGGVTR